MIRIARLDGPQAAEAEDAIRLVYAEAFAEPPYNKTPTDVDGNFRRFRSQTKKPHLPGRAGPDRGGRRTHRHRLRLRPERRYRWWDIVEPPVPHTMRSEDGHRTFGLMELAVRVPWRRQGIARKLHDTLLADLGGAERVILNARPDAEPAQAAYRAWGYRTIGQGRPWAGAGIHRIMLLTVADYRSAAM
ncbi:GNAT family N-acetyltransferase [Yinghuangia aomiensis]